ncbi:hypothetical protein [Aeromicrobium sp.]|uniref:TraR/DksA family transcriptional regulator n=1 Tax=Aeromicrobium sp. TaxID=1871063 RepID=UPI0030C1845F
MDDQRARELLQAETERVQELLTSATSAGQQDETRDDQPESSDGAQQLTAGGLDDALVDNFERRLEALEAARQRVDDGTYGKSVRSGDPIPDERLEADPAAELTVEEASEES